MDASERQVMGSTLEALTLRVEYSVGNPRYADIPLDIGKFLLGCLIGVANYIFIRHSSVNVNNEFLKGKKEEK